MLNAHAFAASAVADTALRTLLHIYTFYAAGPSSQAPCTSYVNASSTSIIIPDDIECCPITDSQPFANALTFTHTYTLQRLHAVQIKVSKSENEKAKKNGRRKQTTKIEVKLN